MTHATPLQTIAPNGTQSAKVCDEQSEMKSIKQIESDEQIKRKYYMTLNSLKKQIDAILSNTPGVGDCELAIELGSPQGQSNRAGCPDMCNIRPDVANLKTDNGVTGNVTVLRFEWN